MIDQSLYDPQAMQRLEQAREPITAGVGVAGCRQEVRREERTAEVGVAGLTDTPPMPTVEQLLSAYGKLRAIVKELASAQARDGERFLRIEHDIKLDHGDLCNLARDCADLGARLQLVESERRMAAAGRMDRFGPNLTQAEHPSDRVVSVPVPAGLPYTVRHGEGDSWQIIDDPSDFGWAIADAECVARLRGDCNTRVKFYRRPGKAPVMLVTHEGYGNEGAHIWSEPVSWSELYEFARDAMRAAEAPPAAMENLMADVAKRMQEAMTVPSELLATTWGRSFLDTAEHRQEERAKNAAARALVGVDPVTRDRQVRAG